MADTQDNNTLGTETGETQEPVTGVEGGSRLDGLEVGDAYGSGLPLMVPPDRSGTDGAVGQNRQAGFGEGSVEDLQRYIAEELGSPVGEDEYGPSDLFPNFGIDGAWGCETQAAWNTLLEAKGIECKEGGSSPCGDNVPACGVSNEIFDKLKEAEEKERQEEEDRKEEEEAKKAKETAFSDQCYLLSNMKAIINSAEIRNQKYDNIHKVKTNDPSTLMNRLRMTRGGMKFLDIRHWELSELTPTIRLYKRYYEGEERVPREVEFKFNSFVDPQTDLQEMLNSQLQRGVGIGIERFDWKLQGVQPETAKKDIAATLSIHAQNFNELFKVRESVDSNGKLIEGGYRIIDLVLLEPKYKNEDVNSIKKQRVFNPKFYEIKVVVGWAATGASSVISPELKAALKNTQITMYLIVTDHKFDFRDDGSVKMNIYFRARLESIMLDKRSDILTDEKTRVERARRKELVNTLLVTQSNLKERKAKCSEAEEQNQKIKEIKEQYQKEIDSERRDAYQNIIKNMIEEESLYSAIVSYKDIEETPDIASTGENTSINLVKYLCKEEELEVEDVPSKPVDGERRINFFFLGDLLNVAVNNVLGKTELAYGNSGDGTMKFVFGPIAFRDPNPDSVATINENIAHIPISVELYNHFFENKIVSQGTDSYPLLVFIRDVIRHLVFEALGPECYRGARSPSVILDTAQITADAKDTDDPMGAKIGDLPYLDLDEYTADVDSEGNDRGDYVFDSFNDSNKKCDYFVVYAYQHEPNSVNYDEDQLKSKSRKNRDFEKGIYHLTTGLDRGLVKTMSFSKTDQPYLREARYMQSDNSPELQLSNVYNCDIDLHGNNLFFPGQQVFVNPRGLGSDLLGDPSKPGSKANILGLGGYHVIKFVNNTIDTSGFSTNLQALFTTSGDGVGTNMHPGSRVGDEYNELCHDIALAIEEYTSLTAGGEGNG